VGVTTNGTHLLKRIGGLVNAGISRIHISLQEEELRTVLGDPESAWRMPQWLEQVLLATSQSNVVVRLNLPVVIARLHQAAAFLRCTAAYKVDLQVFALLPSNHEDDENAPKLLRSMADAENLHRAAVGRPGQITVRPYTPPQGLRCRTCSALQSCKEASRSLRVGVDRKFRPCLATRLWDSDLNDAKLFEQFVEASLLSIDYAWPDIPSVESKTCIAATPSEKVMAKLARGKC
jgi:GTP 3',8-cyclase